MAASTNRASRGRENFFALTLKRPLSVESDVAEDFSIEQQAKAKQDSCRNEKRGKNFDGAGVPDIMFSQGFEATSR
jgi:hypothetical protein